MSAEVLRRAASLMRDRAEAATPPPWVAFRARATNPLDRAPVIGVTRDLTVDYDTDLFATQKCRAEDAEHFASWHPAVALAVADWLDTAGADLWAHGPLCECGSGCLDCDDSLWQPHVRRALAVARTYLGEQSC